VAARRRVPAPECQIGTLATHQGVVAEVRRAMPGIPIVTGEAIYSKEGFAQALTARAADIINPDIANCGGVSAMMDIAAMAQPSTDAFSAYAKDFYALSSKTGAELVAAAEKQIADGNKQLLSAVELLSKNAPAGSEGTVQVLRNTVTAASAAYDQVFKATRQLADQAEAGLANLAKTLS
jgi:hypothetical protein